jgi:rSAM/selenodomain-associated transferase 1
MNEESAADCEILIFAKRPEAGRCKTRLAKHIGDADALLIYQALLAFTLKTVAETPYRKVLMVDPPEAVAAAEDWAPGMDLYLPQCAGDLGSRMSAAVSQAFSRGAKKALLLGCDCPQISKESVISTFAGLDRYDVILGPTVDGGYYLLGLKEDHSSLFQDIPWSTGQVFEKTLNILKFQTLSYISLDTFSDVDTLEDFRQVRHLRPLKHLGIR